MRGVVKMLSRNYLCLRSSRFGDFGRGCCVEVIFKWFRGRDDCFCDLGIRMVVR